MPAKSTQRLIIFLLVGRKISFPFSSCGKQPTIFVDGHLGIDREHWHQLPWPNRRTALPLRFWRSCQQIPKYHLIFHMLLPMLESRIKMQKNRKANDIPWLHKSSDIPIPVPIPIPIRIQSEHVKGAARI